MRIIHQISQTSELQRHCARFLLTAMKPPAGLGCLLVTDGGPRFGWRFAAGRSRATRWHAIVPG